MRTRWKEMAWRGLSSSEGTPNPNHDFPKILIPNIHLPQISGAVSRGYNFASNWKQNAPPTEQHHAAIRATAFPLFFDQILFDWCWIVIEIGSTNNAWYDSNVAMESDCDDDFYSVQYDAFSLNGYEAASDSSKSSIRDDNHEDNAPAVTSSDRKQNGLKYGENVVANGTKPSGSRDDISSISLDEGIEREEGKGVLYNCGILPNNCLPCLASTAPAMDKKGSQTSSPPHLKKKAALKLSFKWRAGEGHVNSALRYSTILKLLFMQRKLEETVTHRLGGACHHLLEEIGSLNMPKEEKDPKLFSTLRERLYNLQATEKSRVCFGISGIHGWGLFALRDIQEEDMVHLAGQKEVPPLL